MSTVICGAVHSAWRISSGLQHIRLYIAVEGSPLSPRSFGLRKSLRAEGGQSFKSRIAYSSAAASQATIRTAMMAPKKGDGSKPKSKPAPPRPSSSVILVSPRNEILLLHRVQTSSSFPSAHVFPGGNLSTQDGELPRDANDPKRHEDSPAYRQAAIRELFEESGILLAKDRASGQMLSFPENVREEGRGVIHRSEETFAQWLQKQHDSAEPDIDGLIPFTHWITPENVPKRYTTQMYIYFLPLPQEAAAKQLLEEVPAEGEREEIQVPTSDGGIEVTEAVFLPATQWLQKARSGEVILFPPQFLLLHLLAQFLDKTPKSTTDLAELESRRAQVVEFVHSGSPPWTQKYISPQMLMVSSDGRAVLALDKPGLELMGSDKRGDSDMVVLVRFSKSGPREVEVRWKKDIFAEKHRDKSIL